MINRLGQLVVLNNKDVLLLELELELAANY